MQYDPAFVAYRPILSAEDKRVLQSLSQTYSLERFRADARNYEEIMVDFVYTSGKIEGNTYDRIDTDNLLRLGMTAGGKRYLDAVMLVNLRDGFEQVMSVGPETSLDRDYVCDLHKTLMKSLLPAHEQGIGRTSGVLIGATTYRPLSDPVRLRTEIAHILAEAGRYQNAFEQSIYLHCNLAYLQYFRDGNKRTARMVQTAALVRGGVLPVFFQDSLIDAYQRATVQYYETGEYASYVAFFKKNYQMVVAQLADLSPDAPVTEHKARKMSSAPSGPENPSDDSAGSGPG